MQKNSFTLNMRLFLFFKNEFIHHYKRIRSPSYSLVEKQERNLINQCCSLVIFVFFFKHIYTSAMTTFKQNKSNRTHKSSDVFLVSKNET